jgi:DNA-binding MarR family transcriptional regulator
MESFRLVTSIRRLHHAIRAEVVDQVHAHGFDDIAAAHIYIFQTPGPDGARPTELAARTQMTKQAMNHLLAGLESAGYLHRVQAQGDGRARLLRLTSKGRRLTRVIQQSAAEIEARWAAALGRDRITELAATLEDLDAAMTERSVAPERT